MAYEAIFEGIFSLISNDPTLVPSVLGPRTNTNMRLYRAWPGWQSFLTTYEPIAPAEGWLVIEEPQPGLRYGTSQYTTDHEHIDVSMHIYGTTYAVAHDALDILDQYFLWTIQQQRDVIWGERILLFTRRIYNAEKYANDLKLTQKDFVYGMEFVRIAQIA